MPDVVIDTNILVIEAGLSDQSHQPCTPCHAGFLAFVLATPGYHIKVDDHIWSEYTARLQNDSEFQSQWLTQMMTTDEKIQKVRRTEIPRGVRVELQEFHFDTGDAKFVRVALATESKHLVSEDSDYSKSVCKLLKKKLKLEVTNAHQAWDCTCANLTAEPSV